MPALEYLELTDRLTCQGSPAIYGVLDARAGDVLEAKDTRAVDDQESLTFSFSKFDRTGEVRDFYTLLRTGRIVKAVYDDESFDEWRIRSTVGGRDGRGSIDATCVSLWLDLVERADASGKGWVSEVVAGNRVFAYTLSQRTASDILSTYVIPNLPAWITLGTVDPTYVIKLLDVDRLTPGALALAVRDALRAVDVSCELRLRRNGTTGYKLDLVTQIGASANTPVFHPANGLLTLVETEDATTQATRVLVKGGTTPDGEVGQLGFARWKVQSVVGTVVTLVDRNGGAAPIAFDNQFVTNYLYRPKTGRTFAITASSAAGSVTCGGGVSTLAADEDVEFRLDEPLTNTRTTSTRYAVSAVPDGTHITLGVSAPITVDGQYTDWYAKVWSAAVAGTVIATTRISTSVAATDILTVASSAGVTNTHYVEFIQLDGAGEVPSFVDHPTYVQADPIGYGVKVREISRNALGITNLVPNSWLRTWTNPANPPDGWTKSGSGTFTRDATITRYGGYSYKFASAAGGPTGVITSPVFYPAWAPGVTQVSLRALVYFTTYTANVADPTTTLTLYAATAAGGVGTLLGRANVRPTNAATPGGQPLVGTDDWIEIAIKGITLGPSTAPYGLIATFDTGFSGVAGAVTGYLDAIECYPFADCPNDSYEFGDATALHQSANNYLRENGTPPKSYTMQVADQARAFPDEYNRLALTIGGAVRAADVENGKDVTVRLLKMERDLLHSLDTVLTLANRPTRVTEDVSALRMKTTRILHAVQQSQTTSSAGTPFVVLAAATALTPNAEIAIAQSAAQSVTLATDSAVSYHPADPTTSPVTSITVGTPPSRLRALPLLS